MKNIEKIWFEYHCKLLNFIKKRVDENEAEDILQDVFLKIFSRIGTIKDNTKIETWIYQITRNAIVDFYRLKRKSNKIPDWIDSPHFDETDNIKQEISSCLIPMIEQLPDKYRSAIKLSEIEGKTQKELSELEKISLSGAKSRVQRGRALLKSMLYDCCKIEINHNNELISCEKNGDCKIC